MKDYSQRTWLDTEQAADTPPPARTSNRGVARTGWGAVICWIALGIHAAFLLRLHFPTL